MSRRKRQDAIEFELISGFAALFLFCFWFIPAFRVLCIILAAVAFLIVVAYIIHRFAVADRRLEIPDRAISMNTYPPNPGYAPPKPALSPSLSEKLHAIDWFQFEKLIAAVYEAKGFSVYRSGGAKADGGIDLILERDGQKTAVQCKHWKTWKVGISQIREFLGALTDAQIPNGVFITLKDYTADARALAAKHNIEILGQPELLRLLESTDWKWNPAILSALDDTKKFCPKCEQEMVLRTAAKGRNAGNQFWGCSTYPRCTGILKCA